MTVGWEDPADNGGCFVTGFAVFVDDGQLGIFNEVNSAEDPNVRGNPGLHSLVISSPFTLASIGQSFRVKIVSYNVDGETESAVGTIVLGDVPDAPTTVVEKVTTPNNHSSNKLTVQFAALPSAGNNGLPILSYSLEIDYNLSGSFQALIGETQDQLGLEYTVNGLTKSQTYAFRYRAKNAYGWGPYSPVS
jgi:hypothetical protein